MLDERAAALFRRSFTAVDGLWFIKVEERFGLEAALEIDTAVWEVMPKIQARMLQEMTGEQRGLTALEHCLSARWHREGYAFDSTPSADGRSLEMTIERCPWYELLVKSGRAHLAPRIGPQICGHEYPVWTAEFGAELRFTLIQSICQGAGSCRFRFERVTDETPMPPCE